MAYEKFSNNIFYVTRDGNYGADDLILTGLNELSDEQLETMSSLSDSSRFDYVEAILNGQDTSDWED